MSILVPGAVLAITENGANVLVWMSQFVCTIFHKKYHFIAFELVQKLTFIYQFLCRDISTFL